MGDKNRETVEELLHRVAKDFVPRNPNSVVVKNGHQMMKPYYNGFMQEKHLCKNGKPCYEPSKYSAVWHGSVIKCEKCGQRYIMEDEGWLLISDFATWMHTHTYSVVIPAIVIILAAAIYLITGMF